MFNPRFIPVLIIRLARFCRLKIFLYPISMVLTWINVFLFGVECTSNCEIGPGLFLPHTSGTVIGAGKIGSNATIFQGVTLGTTQADMAFDISLRPNVGNYVVIGAGAKILGGCTIGDRSIIGANAVVLKSIPPDTLAVGIPAKQKKISHDNNK